MVEQIRVSPEEVRGYGNVCEEHSLDDFIVSSSGLTKEKETVHGALINVYKLVYSLYGLMFDFDRGNKQLYLQMGEADILSFGFDDDSKQLYLLDMARTGLGLGFDEDTNELYISDAPPIVHNYSLAFSAASYVATGGSATLECTLLDNNVPVEGATISVSGSDSSLYTGITNNEGIAQVTVTNITGTVSFTCSYSNVSAQCTVTTITYLINDDASVDNSSTLFGSSIALRGNGANTTSWDGSGYYRITNTSSQKESMRVLAPLDGVTDDFVIEYDSYVEQVGGSSGFVIYNSSTAWEKLTDDSDSQKKYWYGYNDGSFHETSFYGNATTYQKWVHYKFTVQGTTFKMEVTYNDSNVVTRTETIHFNRSSSTQYGLDCEWQSNTKTRYKNLVAYKI